MRQPCDCNEFVALFSQPGAVLVCGDHHLPLGGEFVEPHSLRSLADAPKFGSVFVDEDRPKPYDTLSFLNLPHTDEHCHGEDLNLQRIFCRMNEEIRCGHYRVPLGPRDEDKDGKGYDAGVNTGCCLYRGNGS